MKRVSAKFIPRLLIEDQKNNHLNVCYDLREQVGDDPQILYKLWVEMRLGAAVTTRKQNKHWANGKLLVLQKQRRSDRFHQMLRSCWLVSLMLMELCTRNLFILDKLWINNFIWRCCKDYAIAYVKQQWLVPSPRQCPCPHGLECAAVFGKKTRLRLSLILPIYPTLRHATFSCSLVWKARWKGIVLLMSAKWKGKCWRSWTTSALKSSRNVFSSGKNVGKSVLNQKGSTLKETRTVIVWNLISHFKKIIPVIFGSPLIQFLTSYCRLPTFLKLPHINTIL